jgi:hypothetical protein
VFFLFVLNHRFLTVICVVCCHQSQAKGAESISVKTEVPDKPEMEAVPVTVVTPPPRVTSSEKKSRRHTGDDPANAATSHFPPPAKVWKGLKYKYWTPGAIQPAVKYKKPTDKEITEVMKCICALAPFFQW